TLALAGLLACVAGIAMFRLTTVELVKPKIVSVSDLSSVLGLPVIANLPADAGNAASSGRRIATSGWKLFTPRRLQVITYCAEGFVAIATGACLLSVMIDPSLVREVLADPFGTLSEVVGRCAR